MKTIKPHLTRNRVSLIVKLGSILAAVLALYYQDFAILANEAITSDLASHILIVPFMLAYIIYRKRKILRAAIPLENTSTERTKPITEIIGALLCFLAFVLYWQASYTFYPLEYHLISLPIFLSGCILIIFNTETLKALAFPIALLLFLIPPPMEAIQTLGAQLSFFSSEAAFWILKALGLPVELSTEYGNPTIILEKTPAPITFNIDIACAGVYSLIAFTLFAFFIAYLVKGPISKKLSVFFIGFPLVYALNILRITIIVLVGFLFSEEIAMSMFHLFSGWILIFIGTLILLHILEKIFKIHIFTAKTTMPGCLQCTESQQKEEKFCFNCGKILQYTSISLSKRDICKIAALLLGVSIIIPLNVPVFTLTKGPAQITTQSPTGEQVSTAILPQIEGFGLFFWRRVEEFEILAHQDATLIYYYTPKQNSSRMVYAVVEIAPSYNSLHRWEVCLLFTPQAQGLTPSITVLDRREVQLLENPPTMARFFAFQYMESDSSQVVLYWYARGVFDTGSGAKPEYIKISLIAQLDHPDECAEVEQMLLPMAKEIVNYWEPVVTWPWIATVIAAEGKRITGILIALLAAVIGLQIYRKNQQKLSNFKAYNKLSSKEEKQILLAVHKAAAEKTKPTGRTIAALYQKLAKKPISLDALNETLKLAEEAGFVKKEVANIEDEPIIVWKSQISFPGEQLFMFLRP